MGAINKDNIDKYFQDINTKIDHFFRNGVTAMELKRYFKNGAGMSKFIKRENLGDIDRIEEIIHACVEDRTAMEEVGIKTFENFKEEITYDLNQKIDINIEKTIADHYKVSLGHIESEDNLLTISTLGGGEVTAYIFDNNKVIELLTGVCKELFEIVDNDSISYGALNINIPMKGLVNESEFINSAYSALLKDVNSIVEALLLKETGKEFRFVQKINGINIYEF